MNRTKKTIAEKLASWLMKDIRLNAEAASSTHMYDPEPPRDLKSFGNHNDDKDTV